MYQAKFLIGDEPQTMNRLEIQPSVQCAYSEDEIRTKMLDRQAPAEIVNIATQVLEEYPDAHRISIIKK